jgi:hypothetical protein
MESVYFKPGYKSSLLLHLDSPVAFPFERRRQHILRFVCVRSSHEMIGLIMSTACLAMSTATQRISIKPVIERQACALKWCGKCNWSSFGYNIILSAREATCEIVVSFMMYTSLTSVSFMLNFFGYVTSLYSSQFKDTLLHMLCLACICFVIFDNNEI